MDGEHLSVAIDEQIIYHQLNYEENAIWSLLVANGNFKVVHCGQYKSDGIVAEPKYELTLTNYEMKFMFKNMIRG